LDKYKQRLSVAVVEVSGVWSFVHSAARGDVASTGDDIKNWHSSEIRGTIERKKTKILWLFLP
jgi:hypothetical protein